PAPIVAFLAKLDSSGNSLLYSTYLGGDDYTTAQSVITTKTGEAVVAGQTAASNFPVQNGLQSFAAGGLDAFVLKFAAPFISGFGFSGKNLLIVGGNFDQGAVILLNNRELSTKVKGVSGPLVAKKAGKLIVPGEMLKFQVRNSDGTLSNILRIPGGKVSSLSSPAGENISIVRSH